MRAVLTMGSRRFTADVTLAVCTAVALSWGPTTPVHLAAQDVGDPDLVKLEGEVVDASNNLPVEGAIVSLPNLGLTAVSDGLGYYRIGEIPAGTHAVRVVRLGYEELAADVPVNPGEVLALYLTPGPIPLEGIEVEVVGHNELDWRRMGTSRRAFIGPGEIEDLRDTYLSLDHVLRIRSLPRVRYKPPVQPGGVRDRPDLNGCLRLVTQQGTRACAMIVMDGLPIDEVSAGWMYQTSMYDIYSIRFLGQAEGFFRYGRRGQNGVLEITTHQGRRR